MKRRKTYGSSSISRGRNLQTNRPVTLVGLIYSLLFVGLMFGAVGLVEWIGSFAS